MGQGKAVDPSGRELALRLHAAGVKPKEIMKILKSQFDVEISPSTLQMWRQRASGNGLPTDHFKTALIEDAAERLAYWDKEAKESNSSLAAREKGFVIKRLVDVWLFDRKFLHLNPVDTRYILDHVERCLSNDVGGWRYDFYLDLAENWNMSASELEEQGKVVPAFSLDGTLTKAVLFNLVATDGIEAVERCLQELKQEMKGGQK